MIPVVYALSMTTLQKTDPATNCYRSYRLDLTTSLFGDVGVERRWGRQGSSPRLRIDWYETEDEAARHLERLRTAKIRRGYQETAE